MPHTLDQLRKGIVDFCTVLDQAAIGFEWTYVMLPQLLRNGLQEDNSLEVVRNATVESSLISIRALNEFFDIGTGRAGDIRSRDYEPYSSPGPFLAKDEFNLIGRRIAHLTVDRENDVAWKIPELIRRAYVPSEEFLTFIVEGTGTQYLPDDRRFDVASRLLTCRGMNAYMQRILSRVSD